MKQPQDDLLAELEAALADGDKKGPNINQKLAEFVKHKWARKMSQAKPAEILGKYVQPQNCPDTTPSCGKLSVQIFQASSFAFLSLYSPAKGSDFGSLLYT